MSKRPVKLVIDCSSGTEEYVEFTDAEIAQMKIDQANWEADRAAAEAEATAKAEAKASALAKLAALGLTEEEAAAIAG